MIKIENVNVCNLENAVRGMRNPLNSWEKSDSGYQPANMCDHEFVIGDNDLNLMRRLYNAGKEHRKYLRQCFVSADITAPRYWWPEMDQYKIGTVTNSCSTMHTIHKKEFELSDFSHENLTEGGLHWLEQTIEALNVSRNLYLNTKNKKYWWDLIQLLPQSYNQMRTWTGNYENLISIYFQRKDHKLDEWHTFCDWVLSLPYMREITGIED